MEGFFTGVFKYATMEFILQGALVTLKLSAAALIAGTSLGFVIALMRLSSFAPVRSVAWFYVWLIRGTPLLLQLVFIFDALPAVGIRLDAISTAVIAFTINSAAYISEVIRGGIMAVNRNQWIAAAAFGMTGVQTMRRVVMPQAMRGILPGLGNEAVNLLKSTSLGAIIAVSELTQRSQQIVAQNFEFFPVFTAAALLYLTMTTLIGLSQSWLERLFHVDRETSERDRRNIESALSASSPAVATELSADTNNKSPAQAFLSMRGVCKNYGDKQILRGVDIDVARGEVIAILGPSGSGKSTLLRLVNHLESVDGGEILLEGSPIGYVRKNERLVPVSNLAAARAAARIGFVFQQFNLFDHLTAIENVAEAPIQVYGEARESALKNAHDLLGGMGLAQHIHHRPHRLSGGQQQRVAIARALAIRPRLILLDEPTSALDPELVGDVLLAIKRLADRGITMIIVTHEIRFARDVADRVVFMDEGRVVEAGPPAEVIDNPRVERTKQFLRSLQAENGDTSVSGVKSDA